MVIVISHLAFIIGKFLLDKLKCWTLEDSYYSQCDSDIDSTSIYDHFDSYDDYTLPPPSKKNSVYESDLNGIPLSPPFLKRFEVVINILQNNNYAHFRKVVEFGCSDLRFVQDLKNLDHLTTLVFVDKDEEILEESKQRINPTDDDLHFIRKNPLNIKVCAGCCSNYDQVLNNTDAVLCLELIQTLSEDILYKTVNNIFKHIAPEVVVFTTPNKEFNPLLNITSNLKRHHSHVFEWTRKEFTDWCYRIVNKYPEYRVSFYGICYAGRSYLDYLGPLTQTAVFTRPRNIKKKLHERSNDSYKLIADVEYYCPTDAELLEQIISLIKDSNKKTSNEWEFTKCKEQEIPILEVFSSFYANIGYQRFIEIIQNDGWIVDHDRNVITSCPYQFS